MTFGGFPPSRSGFRERITAAPNETTPGKGHNSRAADVSRTAKEIHDIVRGEWIRPDTSPNQRWVVELLCSDLPAIAKLYGIVAKMHGDWSGGSIFPGLDRMQTLTSLSRPTAIKAKNALVEAGFMEFEKKSKGRLPDILKLAFPDDEEHANGKAALPLNGAQQSKSFTVKAVYENATVKNDPSNGKAALPDLVLPCVVEKEGSITRASSCAFSGLQAESADASAELFGPGEVPASIGPLPTKEQLERWHEITQRWGHAPDAILPKKPVDFKVGQWLKNDVKALGSRLEPEIVNAALETTLAAMEGKTMEQPGSGSKKGAGAAKAWFFKAFSANLDLLRQREHDARVHAKTVEAKAEIEVDGAKAANAKKLGALDHRIALGNDATVKRIESGAANGARMMNGASAPAAERFDERAPKVVEVCGTWITPFAANSILTDVPGSTKVIVFKALMKTGKHLNHLTKPGEDVILPHARRFTIFEVHGYPEARCGSEVATTGDYGRHFSSTWVCLSQKFVDGIVEKHKTSLVAAHDAFDDVTQRLRDVSAERYLTLQAEIEKKLEEKLAEREEREARLAEEARIRREREAKEREQREAQQAEDAKNFVWSDGKLDLSDLGRKALAGTDLDWATKLIALQDWIHVRKIPPSAFQLSDLWQELLRGAEFFPAALTKNEAFEELPF